MENSIAEVSLKYKTNTPLESLPVIDTPKKAEELLRKVWDHDAILLKEEFIVLLLNNAKRCLGWTKISSGGATATIVDPAPVFQVALLGNASSIILAHNHPSGLLQESAADINLTNRIVKAGRLIRALLISLKIFNYRQHYIEIPRNVCTNICT